MNITNKLLDKSKKILLSSVSGEGIAEDLLRSVCGESGAPVIFAPITEKEIARAASLAGEIPLPRFELFIKRGISGRPIIR